MSRVRVKFHRGRRETWESERGGGVGGKGKEDERPGAGARTRGGRVGVGEPSRTMEALQPCCVAASRAGPLQETHAGVS